MRPSKILVTGAGGTLGRALVALGAHGLTHAELDVTDRRAVQGALKRYQPEAVIFCAALTDVDRCATNSRAWAVNVDAPAYMARQLPTWFISSNYVFDGPGPHAPDSPRQPLMAYGEQKVAAEDAVLAAGGHVVRTAWMYGPGGSNFPSRLPQLLLAGPVKAHSGWQVQPTYAPDLAAALMQLPEGLNHLVGSEQTTWLEFARHCARELGMSPRRVLSVARLPIGPRPQDARLTPATLPGWRDALPRHIAASTSGD